MDLRNYLSRKAFADKVGVTPERVRQWAAQGRLPIKRFGGRLYIHREAKRPQPLTRGGLSGKPEIAIENGPIRVAERVRQAQATSPEGIMNAPD